MFEVGRSKSQLDNPFTADQLTPKKALVIKPDINLMSGGIKSKEVKTGVLVNSVLPYEAGGAKRPIPTVTQWLLYENQIHLHKLKMQDPYNHPDKGVHVEIGSTVDSVLCEYTEGTKIHIYMMQMWLDNYFWSEGKSKVHDLPDPMSVSAIWRSTLWMFLRQFYSMKQVVRHDCPSIWLGYYLMCTINETGTARIPSTLKDLTVQIDIYPRYVSNDDPRLHLLFKEYMGEKSRSSNDHKMQDTEVHTVEEINSPQEGVQEEADSDTNSNAERLKATRDKEEQEEGSDYKAREDTSGDADLAYMLENLSSDDSSEEYEVANKSKKGTRRTKGQGPKKSKGKKDKRGKENKTSPSECMKQLKNIKQCKDTDQEINNEGDMEVEMEKSIEGHDSPEHQSPEDMAVEPREETECEAVEDAEPNDDTSVASAEWDGRCRLKNCQRENTDSEEEGEECEMDEEEENNDDDQASPGTNTQPSVNMMSANNITAQTKMALPEFEGTIILQPAVLTANPEVGNAEDELLIDSGATHHVFRTIAGIERFLRLNNDVNLWVEVADGGRMRVTHTGFAKDIGLMMVCPDITRDILSLIQLLKNNTTFEMDNAGYTMRHGSGMVVKGPMNNNNTFHVPHGVFLLMLPRMAIQVFSNNANIATNTTDEPREHNINVPMINNPNTDMPDNNNDNTGTAPISGDKGDNTAKTQETQTEKPRVMVYIRGQRERAKAVKELHDQLHCSDDALKLALNNGLIVGTHLVAADVDVFRDIYGPYLACLAGKVIKPPYTTPSNAPPTTDEAENIHTDILKYEQKQVGGYVKYNTQTHTDSIPVFATQSTYDTIGDGETHAKGEKS
jgi:hypothetical protein